MNRKFKLGILAVMILLQIIIQRYINVLHINLDLLYLILIFTAVKSGFYKTMAAASVIGLVTDYFSMQTFGVFGFSRTITAFILHQTAGHIDLKNNVFVFLFISISLCISNSLANLFFVFIKGGIGFNFNLVIYQPVLTALLGIALLSSGRIKRNLDVY